MDHPYNSQELETTFQIAAIAEEFGFSMPSAPYMMSIFTRCAVTFESEFDGQDRECRVRRFAIEQLIIEVEHRRGSCKPGYPKLPSIRQPLNIEYWCAVNMDEWVYLAEFDDRILTKGDFVKLCAGDSKAAFELYKQCDGERPEELLRALTEGRNPHSLHGSESLVSA